MATSLRRMTGRAPDDPGRSATPLELFFDLVFVVAVALASHELLLFFEENHFLDGVIRYLMVFFAIWWAWMNFTWFATEYDTDDWLYRVVTLVQMGGALVMAAGIPDAMHELDNTVLVAGYVIMRMALVFQWVRAAIQSPDTRARCLRYAAGVTLVQVMWVSAVVAGWEFTLPFFLVGAALELAVPVIAERATPPQWHPHHVSERYGLFTIIVLGETVLASLNSVVAALEETDEKAAIARIAIVGFVVVGGMWWLYFSVPQGHLLRRGFWRAVVWGYGHYVVFASAAAVSAGIGMAVARELGHLEVTDARVAATFCVPVAVYVGSVWTLSLRHAGDALVNAAILAGVAVTLLAIVTPAPLVIIAATVVALVGIVVWRLDAAAEGAHAPGTEPGSVA